jgi:hypothetical protein
LFVGVSGFPLFYLEAVPICKDDPNELLCVAECKLWKWGMCKRIAQSQAMLDLLCLSAADVVLLAADANVGEMVTMLMPMQRSQCQGSDRQRW